MPEQLVETIETTADDILTVKEAAEILGRSVQATRSLIWRGSIRGRKVGKPGVWVTTRWEVVEYMAWARTHRHYERRRPTSGRYLSGV